MCIGLRPVFLPSGLSSGAAATAAIRNTEVNLMRETINRRGSSSSTNKKNKSKTTTTTATAATSSQSKNHTSNSSSKASSQTSLSSDTIIGTAPSVAMCNSPTVITTSSSFPRRSINNNAECVLGSSTRKRSRPEPILSISQPSHDSNNNDIGRDGINKKVRRTNHHHKSTKSSSNNKSVSFKDGMSSRTSLYTMVDTEKKDLWYSLDDCATMNETLKHDIRNFRSTHVDTVRHLLCVSSQCSYTKPNTTYLDTVRLQLPNDCHGLERGLLPPKHRQRRQEHVRKVVEAQQMMKDWYKMGQQQSVKNDSESMKVLKDDGNNSKKISAKQNEEQQKDGITRDQSSNTNSSSSRKSSSSTSRSARRPYMVNKIDLVIAARARKSSQSSRLFAQLLGREVATGVKE